MSFPSADLAGLAILASLLVFFFWLGAAKRRLERRRRRVSGPLSP